MIHARLRAAAGRDRIPTDGLVARYDLDSSLIDTSGNSFDGTAVSTASYTAGVLGQALDGDGANYVTLPALGISGSTPRTLSLWVKKGAATSIKRLVGWGDSGGNLQQCILYSSVNSNGQLYWSFNNSDIRTGSGLLTTTAFSHVCVRYAGGTISTTSVDIFHNNVSQAKTKAGSQTGAANTINSDYTMMGSASGTVIFDGDIDLVRLYNRALTNDEITQLYNEGA